MIDLHNCDNLLGFGDNIKNYMEIGSLNTLVLSGCKQLNASNLNFNLKACQSTLTSLNLENCCNLEALPDNIGLLSSLQRLRLSGSNVESLSPNIKTLNNLKELRLDNCKKLVSVSVSDLPPSLRLFSAINCISLVTDLTTLDIPFEHRSKPQPYPQSVFFPGTHVPKRFSFRSHQGSASAVTVRPLPESGLYGFVFCLVLSKSNDEYRAVQCNIYQNSKYIGGKATSLGNLHLVMDHVFLWYLDIRSGATHISLHGQIERRGGWHNPHNMSFQFSLENEEGEWSTERIIGCGVLPLYHLEESNKDSHQTIEVVSEEEDLTNNEPVMLDRVDSHVEIDSPHLESDSWDPISELESLLHDSYKLSPMCTDSTIVSVLRDPNVASILENLETLLETPLEILSSDDEVKQKFHKILEQLGQFENQIPIRLHHVICKLRTFIEGVDVKFVSAQNIIQDYDQLLQSRSLISKKLESAKARESQIISEISRGKMQFEKINSEIVELEQKLSGLVELRDKVKKELEHCEVIKSNHKTEVAQYWLPECKTVLINLKESETPYKVASLNQ